MHTMFTSPKNIVHTMFTPPDLKTLLRNNQFFYKSLRNQHFFHNSKWLCFAALHQAKQKNYGCFD